MTGLTFRRACAEDVPAIIGLLADDILGVSRESAGSENTQSAYFDAFDEIDADPSQLLCVADLHGEIVGTLQLTFIPGLARCGAKRGLIEAVRVASAHRGKKIGDTMFAWAVEQCRERGCRLVQLTTDRSRPDAHRFYERLGFQATHIGYKLEL